MMFNLFNLPLYPTLSPSFSNCLFLNPIPLFSSSIALSLPLSQLSSFCLPLTFSHYSFSLSPLSLLVDLSMLFLLMSSSFALSPSISLPLFLPLSFSHYFSLSLSLSPCASFYYSLLMSLNTYDLNFKVPVYHWHISYCHIASCIKLTQY